MARTIGRSGPLRIAIADDSGLIFSDDYRQGWAAGFRSVGADVRTFDISVLRKIPRGQSPYRATVMRGTPKALADQIAAFHPDLVWCHHGRAAANVDFQATLRRHGIRTAVYLCDEPYESGETAQYSTEFDFVFSMDPCTVELHRRARARRGGVYYLPPCADTTHFVRQPYHVDGELVRTRSAFFLGNASLIPRREWLEPIQRLVQGTDIRFFATPKKGDPRWVKLEQHPELYGSCVVGLNVHRSPVITRACFENRVLQRGKMPIPAGMALCPQMPRQEGTGFWNDGNYPAAHVNPRFFEMAACGTLVVSDDHRSELARMFPMAPRADSPERFYELVRYFTEHTDEAEEIGQACSILVSRRHTYPHRAAEVLIRVGLKELLEGKLLSSLGEPEDWLSPQDCGPLGISSYLGRTGPSERWSPQLGMLLTRQSGRPSEASSLDAPTPWL